MSKKIEDYFHFYLGCNLQVQNQGGFIETLIASSYESFRDAIILGSIPILRPLSSMTEEERAELEATKAFQRATPVHQIGIRVWTAESYRYALSKGFDLFGLIAEGLAIESTNIKQS